MAENAADTQCDHCGQVDNHPKSHWNSGQSFHFDCLPHDLRDEWLASNENTQKLLDAVNSGVKGDDLRAFSAELHAAQGDS